MKFAEVIEFRKDVYFEGAVQADWFYNPELSAKVAVNYVFHGNEYFDGALEQHKIGSIRVDSVTLLKKIAQKFTKENSNPLTLAIADYGTGKSHLAVTMAHLFSGPNYCPQVFNKVIENIKKINTEEGERVKELFASKNFVLMLNGMNDFNLNSEILSVTQKSLKLYGVDSSFLSKISKSYETASNFLERTEKSCLHLYEKYATEFKWSEKSDLLIERLHKNLLTDEIAFQILDSVYEEITGQNIAWDKGISAKEILDLLVEELCEKQKFFDHIVVLFDEFGRFLEYASGVNNSGKTGDSALQQMFEAAQNASGKIQIVNFIQSDIKTYLQRVDQTSNISRYIGRYDSSDKYHISSNLETVFANLIYRKNRKAFEDFIIMWQCDETSRWKQANYNMNRWLLTKGIWKEYRTFRDIIVEGIYPLHPLSTYMLTNLSDYLQKRSSLSLINSYIEKLHDIDIEKEKPLIMPEELMKGDLFNEMLSAEESGRQASQFCIAYNAIISKIGDKLPDDTLKVLRANLILRILKFRTTSYDDVKLAIEFCTGLTQEAIIKALNLLEHEYAVLGFDNFANCFDFMADANGYHDYKIVKNRNRVNFTASISDLEDIQVKNLFELTESITTDFGENHYIQTGEWTFHQHFFIIQKFTEYVAKSVISAWKNANSFKIEKGQLVWIYLNRDSSSDDVENLKSLSKLYENKPIILMLINDADNKLFDCVQELKCLQSLDMINRKKYEKYYNEDLCKVEQNISNIFKSLKKQRKYITPKGIAQFEDKMSKELTKIFENVYTQTVPFNFDGLTGTHGVNFYVTIFNFLLSESISNDTIHNYPIDIRNRIEALFSSEAKNSWKCLSSKGKILPPENPQIRLIFDELKSEYISKNSLPLVAIFFAYSQPPFGLCDEIVLFLIAIFIANMNYGLKISYHNENYTVSAWRNLLLSSKKQNISNIISVVKDSTLIHVNLNEIEEKFVNLFDEIDSNKNLKNFPFLNDKFKTLLSSDSVPASLKNRQIISDKNLKDGLAALEKWQLKLQIIKSNLIASANEIVPKAIDGLDSLSEVSDKIVAESEKYDFSDIMADVEELKTEAKTNLSENFTSWLNSLKCITEDSFYDLKSLQKKYCEKLRKLGNDEYAERLQNHINNEIKDIDSIKERLSLRKDLSSFISRSSISDYTPIPALDELLEDSYELQGRILKYETSFDSELKNLCQTFKTKMARIQNAKLEIDREIKSLSDSISSLREFEQINNLKTRINKLFGKGFDKSEKPEFSDFLAESITFKQDYEKLAQCSCSIKKFDEVKADLLKKYTNCKQNFNQLEILKSKIDSMNSDFVFADVKWRRENLEINEGDRKSLILWKEKIQVLPDYLSSRTLDELSKTKAKVEGILSKQNIQTIIDYFERLTPEERKKCLSILNELKL